ncbi:phosphoribosylaminoimidazolesuccinocarboxamide synthase [Alienimonas californiensis]|uniref:Phosphoribosylaminoimidazole-succinocarboxamide synthase n=1 Tax=Alienimonas californiensis TaxID=2527989 RepID=A0A517PDX3_9PLAN|nr:phosphoribosylaminoimidazolesuccinocarboxamide synthase [Alienimonas californiensis]QDT17578.1 Phosphoribosylaminoimidazole-succinocarboxamide synthase [Alienimonas californiensis]
MTRSAFRRDAAGAVLQTEFPDLPVLRGKVRDVFDLTPLAGRIPELAGCLLVCASDRLSAFDYVLPTGIPGKGRVLTSLSNWWFDFLNVPDHRTGRSVDDLPLDGLADDDRRELAARAVIARRCEMFPVECVARGYLSGSGWKEYQANRAVCGVPLPAGLTESARLPSPIFTPATKAAEGHDENVSIERAAEAVGVKTAERLRVLTLALYEKAAAHAAECGLILADTKFEFGALPGETDASGEPVLRLCDEALTPDSSRYWPAEGYASGGAQPSFDKQFVRDWLLASDWDRNSPPPPLPPEIAERTAEKYRAAHRLLTGADAP